MCWADKCCFIVGVDNGSMALGIGSFILSGILTVISAVMLTVDNADGQALSLTSVLQSSLGESTVRIVIWVTLFFALLTMTASVLLVVGIKKNRPGLVLSFFAFSIFLTIVCQLAALLLLLDRHWITALVMFCASLLNIHFLVVVHTVYEGLLRGTEFFFSPHDRLEELSVDEA